MMKGSPHRSPAAPMLSARTDTPDRKQFRLAPVTILIAVKYTEITNLDQGLALTIEDVEVRRLPKR
jgi:hypothetical protein